MFYQRAVAPYPYYHTNIMSLTGTASLLQRQSTRNRWRKETMCFRVHGSPRGHAVLKIRRGLEASVSRSTDQPDRNTRKIQTCHASLAVIQDEDAINSLDTGPVSTCGLPCIVRDPCSLRQTQPWSPLYEDANGSRLRLP